MHSSRWGRVRIAEGRASCFCGCRPHLRCLRAGRRNGGCPEHRGTLAAGGAGRARKPFRVGEVIPLTTRRRSRTLPSEDELVDVSRETVNAVVSVIGAQLITGIGMNDQARRASRRLPVSLPSVRVRNLQVCLP